MFRMDDNQLCDVAQFLNISEDHLDLLARAVEMQGDLELPADPSENPGLMRRIAKNYRILREESGGDCGPDDADADADAEVRKPHCSEGFRQVVRQYAGFKGHEAD